MVAITRAMARMLKGSSPDSILDISETAERGSQSDHSEDSSSEWEIYTRRRETRRDESETSHKEALETTISFLSMEEEEKR